MKKHYTTPEVEIIKVNSSEIICTSVGPSTVGNPHTVNSSEIICTSVGFGDGDTPIMHAKGRGDFDFDDDFWDE